MAAAKDFYDDEHLVIDQRVLTTERLAMRNPDEGDIDAIVALADNRHVAEMLSRMPHPYGRTEARNFIAVTASERAGVVYALTRREDGRFLGCAGLNSTDRGLELGYWIGEPYWRNGYATEAAHALVDLAFEASGITVLHGACRVINPASRRVLHKCGFQYAGQGMMHSLVAGQVPIERYRLDRRTWTSLRNWKHA